MTPTEDQIRKSFKWDVPSSGRHVSKCLDDVARIMHEQLPKLAVMLNKQFPSVSYEQAQQFVTVAYRTLEPRIRNFEGAWKGENHMPHPLTEDDDPIAHSMLRNIYTLAAMYVFNSTPGKVEFVAVPEKEYEKVLAVPTAQPTLVGAK